ncbi:NUDIX domain-containing protein [Aliarcobacter butzleri]|uniref:NUDIX domain-containing protein n=1 Tax=Aliarcobacter butzleri TaxID=28197 RepID=A0AAP4PWY8_9BACT|nr:NUDIX domain-containing protein [Aliarcobacter butzleri]KLE05876.1 NUDIX hydrolase [Aliarcobacter butzleri L353]MCG3664053.1 NUDIX domain-containing protein [Aliarcobacter butzleri]MCG3673162.1 NUDIX domain-containing protein [Aliarcobacter butzleri]MCG3695912.1 NUDIX domain-containing protein [Aliarcobacter butzleri]MCG3705752.1 NUDIX domain-containing protein [Aliarcobacter butzleri]
MASLVKAYGIVPYYVKGDDIKILLCKSVASKDRWGCLKGTKTRNETAYECAKREFFEESSISVDVALFEEYFEQLNDDKDVGVWLVNFKNIENIEKYFTNDTLKEQYLSWENSKVKFFSLNNLPKIKKKQQDLITEIKDFLKSKNLHH